MLQSPDQRDTTTRGTIRLLQKTYVSRGCISSCQFTIVDSTIQNGYIRVLVEIFTPFFAGSAWSLAMQGIFKFNY